MFTGIVERVGTVISSSDRRLEVACDLSDLTGGESVGVNGVCLTVSSVLAGGFTADLSEETLRRSSLSSLRRGDHVNLERAMPAGGRFGGHLVQGHVDAVGSVLDSTSMPASVEMRFSVPGHLHRYLVEKGSVAVDGVSLTVSAIDESSFAASLIPHTLASTTLGKKAVGDPVNIEVDVLAKYVERLLAGAGQ